MKIINPTYPMYIVSKGRHDSMLTSLAFGRMKIPHYIAIESHEENAYNQAVERLHLSDYVTLLIAPFSNHGDGPGRARNFVWDHALSLGSSSHWVFDDNIKDFYRLHQNQRIRVGSGVMFKIMEDFIDRYDNVPVSGLQYRFFCASGNEYPPYVKNTRIYSSLLIRNDCKFRWRGRYNEDTDLSLRVLKDGDCTIQFNIFLQDKAATQTVGGGNTSEFYKPDQLGKVNAQGTIQKTKMLMDLHPDVTKVVYRYQRWHHYVDYSPFKKNQLRLKPGVVIPEGVNNYGLKLITNWSPTSL